MRTPRFLYAGGLAVMLAPLAPAWAQRDEHQRGDRPEQQERQPASEGPPRRAPPPQRASPAQPQPQPRPQPQVQPQPRPPPQAAQVPRSRVPPVAGQVQRPPQPARVEAGRAERAGERQGGDRGDDQGRTAEARGRTWQERGGYTGYRISPTRYRGAFGPLHGFRFPNERVVVVGGAPRFEYGGLWFSVMDPWPEAWGEDWEGDADVYIDDAGDGYYLYNRRFPTERVALTVSRS